MAGFPLWASMATMGLVTSIYTSLVGTGFVPNVSRSSSDSYINIIKSLLRCRRRPLITEIICKEVGVPPRSGIVHSILLVRSRNDIISQPCGTTAGSTAMLSFYSPHSYSRNLTWYYSMFNKEATCALIISSVTHTHTHNTHTHT